MKKLIVCILICAATAFAGTDKAQMDNFKKESVVLRNAIGDAVSSVIPGRNYLDLPKATYLEGYGAVITLEASLAPTRSPFSSPETPEQVRKTVNQRRKDLTQKLEALLKQRVGTMQSILPNDSVTIVLYLLNSNPADVPDLPSQIILTAKKPVQKDDPTQVTIQEF
jgi:hypothetical protein